MPHAATHRLLPPFTAALLAAIGAGCAGPDGGRTVDFGADIQPILSNNCYVCHGPDPSTREGGLRLDVRDSALVALESGTVPIIPGDPASSELWRRVSSSDPVERMPPPEAKKVLSPHEIDLLEAWIEQGAPYRPHWAFVSPVAQAPPPVRRLVVPSHPIDRFIQAGLQDAGLRPSPEAPPERLVRRLSFVLTGLPPSLEGTEAFLSDSSPDAYERLVDRLLASPHFGEHWARHWMDVVRYADTKGHEFDYPVVGAWTYRDYLIRAFNQDLPYDRFVLEHLAGDLLTPRLNSEEGFNEAAVATVYYALGEGTHSPVDLQVDEAGRIDNIIDVTGKAFQGLTLACARCHDHKFDPIPTADYYSLYGIVKSTRFALRDVSETNAAAETIRRLEGIDGDIRRAVGRRWLDGIRNRESPWPRLEIATPPVPSDSSTTVLADFRVAESFEGWRADGPAFGDRPRSGRLVVENGTIRGVLGPRVSSAAHTPRFFGVLRSPTFFADADRLVVRAAGRASRIRIVVDNFQLIQYPIYGGLEQAVDDPEMRDYVFDVARWRGRPAYIELFPGYFEQHDPVVDDGAYIEAEYAWMTDARPRDARYDVWEGDTLEAALHDAVSRWMADRAMGVDAALLDRALAAGLLDADATDFEAEYLRRLEIEASIPPARLAMAVLDGDGADHPVFVRGNVGMPTLEPVSRRLLSVLDATQAPIGGARSGRLEWARAVVEPGNPLTARVMVNRLWHYVFGRGLVETVDNFGLQGARPTHPELLDYLAVRFVEEGWSIKSMLRLLVTSAAFRRSTQAGDRALALDPDNRLWHQYPVRRLEAEAIRDAMLAVSGRLDPTPYGPPVSVFLSEFMNGRGRPAESGPLDGNGRRSLYVAVRRNFLSPFLLVFDMPIPFSTFGKRNESNVPAQSLALLNDPFVAQQAEVWARRVVGLKELDAGQRVRWMYRAALAREATPAEVEEALAFLKEQSALYGIPEGRDDVRPWREYAHALFNLKEFIHLV